MIDSITPALCKKCGNSLTGKFCSECGQPATVKRITLRGLLHDVFHFFTHLDKGFGYTIKQLFREPGHMQRKYIEGDRAAHQKPFSMFFICATVAGFSRYWINLLLISYFDSGDISEAKFFNEYMVLFQIALMPVNCLITWLFFYRSRYNFAELGILTLYNMSAVFLIVTVIGLFRPLWPRLDTAYLELPILTVYFAITMINFFNDQPKWLVVLKSVLMLLLLFVMLSTMEDIVIDFISTKVGND